ncbi:MAG: SPOR domain-containing protein [Epsilonproteobacteria bacterium]|nr:SPOR domain-containing protein [Campylobacterota bacterium]
MEEKSELGDIILNKNTAPTNNKKIILAVATLGIILIIVVLLMNSFSSSEEKNLPQAVLPPKPHTTQTTKEIQQEPLFEDVEVVEETPQAEDAKLEAVAQKLKAQTQNQQAVVEKVPDPIVTPKQPVKKVVKHQPTPKKTIHKGHYYVQVGSFTKYKPNKEFLHKITSRGYSYKFHKVTRNGKTLNKVLIGPFKTEKEARKALKTIRKHIEKGAFLTKI